MSPFYIEASYDGTSEKICETHNLADLYLAKDTLVMCFAGQPELNAHGTTVQQQLFGKLSVKVDTSTAPFNNWEVYRKGRLDSTDVE